MIENKIIDSLKIRYSHIHPLIFQRSIEHASTAGELFDILESLPDKYPIFWDDNERCWKYTNDFTFYKQFLGEMK